jgi:putative MATE family efflux protein
VKSGFTSGSIPRQLAAFSLPIWLANMLQASMQLINNLWVGNLLGSEAFAAVTVATAILMVVLAFVLGVNNATLTIFAQLKGTNNQQKINSYLSAFIIILTVISVALSIAGYVFSKPILVWMNAPDSILPDAELYLKIYFAGTALLVGYNFIGTALRAFGDSKTPLYFVLIATLLVTVLNPVLVAGFGMGVEGAAYAMVLAQSIAFIYSLVYLSKRFKNYRFQLQTPKWIEIKNILGLGIPSGLQMIVIYAGLSVILALVNTLGEAAVAGFGAAQRLDNIILLPAVALGTAATAMAAQNIGAQQWDRVTQIVRTGILYTVSIMLFISAALFIFAEPLIKLFVRDQNSVAFGTTYLKIVACFYPFIGLNFIFNGIVRGAGAMFQVLALNIISLWILRVPLTYWATSIYGDSGVAIGVGLSFFASCLCSFAYYRWGGWRKKTLFT